MSDFVETRLADRQKQIQELVNRLAYDRMIATKTIEDIDRKIASLEETYNGNRQTLADLTTQREMDAAKPAEVKDTGVTT